MSFEQLPYSETHSSYSSIPLPQRKYFGIDESGVPELGTECVIVATNSPRSRDAVPLKPCKKLRCPGAGNAEPYGDFKFAVLTPEMLQVARDVFHPPAQNFHKKFGNSYYKYKLETYAAAMLLNESGFNPWTDIAIVDSYGDSYRPSAPKHFHGDFLYAISRLYDREVPADCVVFVPDADVTVPVVMNADRNALRLREKKALYVGRRVSITPDDVLSFALQDMRYNDAFPRNPPRMAWN